MFTPHNILNFSEQVKVTGCQIRRTGRIVHNSGLVFDQNLTRNERGVRGCIVFVYAGAMRSLPTNLVKTFGAIFAHSFLMFKSSFQIFRTVPILIPRSYAIILMVIQRSNIKNVLPGFTEF